MVEQATPSRKRSPLPSAQFTGCGSICQATTPAPPNLKVSVGGLTLLFTTLSSAYTNYTFLFTATSSLTALSFTNVGQYAISYPQIDNVSVNVPEGGATVALFGLGLLAVGLVKQKLVTS